MVGQEQVIVAQVKNRVAPSSDDRVVAVALSVIFTFWVIEKTNSRIRGNQGFCHSPQLVSHSVTEYQHFDVALRLSKSTRGGKLEGFSSTVRRNYYGCTGLHSPIPVTGPSQSRGEADQPEP